MVTIVSCCVALYGIVGMLTMDVRAPWRSKAARFLDKPVTRYEGWEAFWMGFGYVFTALLMYFYIGGIGWEKWLEHRKRLVWSSLAGIVICIIVSSIVGKGANT